MENASTVNWDVALDRAEGVPMIVGDHRDFLFVTGLGGTSRDIAQINGGGPNLYALGGAMGAAASTGLGLALAQPDRRVMVVTGDGELFMNVGTLATIGVMNPPNLSILCVDNGHYGETGYQLSHTGRGADLELIARGSGIQHTASVLERDDYEHGAQVIRRDDGTSFVLLRVTTTEAPTPPRDRYGPAGRLRFKEALLGTGGTA